MKRTMIAICLTMFLTAAVGCLPSRFPYGGSWDRHNWVSTPSMPLTVTLKDVITGEELLKVDIPVRMMLVMDLDHKQDWTASQGGALPAETVEWEVLPVDTILPGSLANKKELSGNEVIIKVTVRDAETEDAATMQYQPIENGEGNGSPTYTPQGPATREVSQPEAPVDDPEMQSDTGVSSPPSNNDLGADDAPKRTPRYTPTEPEAAPVEDAGDLEDALD